MFLSSSFRTIASILRCTLVSETFYRYDFNLMNMILFELISVSYFAD